ncbi:MAG: right-handed parallel beta-helix repeat-containing protein [bacterium]|nr:right-handed parallel beta-helix repeat-containing protein [bacterium]
MTPQRFSLPLTLLLAFLAIPSLLYATDVSGPVTGTWTLSGSPYNVVGEITIPANQSLTIEPGVQVIFQRWYKFIINGNLQAVGTILDSITFTAANTAIGWHGLRFYDFSTPSDSSRLAYCKISYGKSSWVNSAGDDKNGGAIYCSNSSKLRIERCLICNNQTGDITGFEGYQGTAPNTPGGPGENVTTGSGGAIYLTNSNPLITNNTFINNRTGNATGGTGGMGGANGYVGNAYIGSAGGNGGWGESGSGGAIYCSHSSPIISGNILSHNFTGDARGGAGGYGGYASSYNPNIWAIGGDGGNGNFGKAGSGAGIASTHAWVFNNNLLYGNSTGDGYGGDGGHGGWGDGEVREDGGDGGDGGNGYSGNGCAIYLPGISTDEFLCYITFSENRCGVYHAGAAGPLGWGGGSWPGSPGAGSNGVATIYCDVSDDLTISNSIFFRNFPNGEEFNTLPTVSYSDISNYPGIGNIQADPLFVSMANLPCFLSQIAAGQSIQSPCVDAGCPDSTIIFGTTRTDAVQDSGILDMGFHYSAISTQPVLAHSPQSLHFSAAFGGSNPDGLKLKIANMGADYFNYTLSENLPWLSLSSYGGGPIFFGDYDSIEVNVDIAGLALGEYHGYIVVTAPGAVGSPDTVIVSLVVAETILTINPDSLLFSALYGSSNPPAQSFIINNPGFGSYNYSIIDTISWLSVNPMAGGPIPPADTLTVSVYLAGLPAGLYEADVIINVPAYVIGNNRVHVTLDYGYTNSLQGPLSGRLFQSNYNIINDIRINSGDSLIIDPGSRFAFQGPYHFYVNGYLRAVGNETDSIIFSPNSGIAWEGISFNGVAGDTSEMDYCTISGSDSSGLYLYYSSPRFSHCLITDNSSNFGGGGIRSFNSGSHFDNCTISNNVASGVTPFGGGIHITFANLSFTDCLIENNLAEGSSGRGGGVYITSGGTQTQFNHCSIISNSAIGLADAVGGGIYVTAGHITLSHCIISNNRAITNDLAIGAGGRFTGSNATLINCTIVENQFSDSAGTKWGSGISLGVQTATTIRNCVIADNSDDGIHAEQYSSNLAVQYNDFHGNPLGNFISPFFPGFGLLTQTNANGDSCDVYHNILLDPLFVDPDSGDYHLTANSPCIDAGDPSSPYDPDSTIADMGAFYFYHQVGVQEKPKVDIPTTFSLLPPFPNPFNPTTTIRFGLPVASRVTLELFDISGRAVGAQHASPLQAAWYPAGYHEIAFDGSKLASGVYICRIQAGDFTASQKMVLLK